MVTLEGLGGSSADVSGFDLSGYVKLFSVPEEGRGEGMMFL